MNMSENQNSNQESDQLFINKINGFKYSFVYMSDNKIFLDAKSMYFKIGNLKIFKNFIKFNEKNISLADIEFVTKYKWIVIIKLVNSTELIKIWTKYYPTKKNHSYMVQFWDILNQIIPRQKFNEEIIVKDNLFLINDMERIKLFYKFNILAVVFFEIIFFLMIIQAINLQDTVGELYRMRLDSLNLPIGNYILTIIECVIVIVMAVVWPIIDLIVILLFFSDISVLFNILGFLLIRLVITYILQTNEYFRELVENLFAKI
jgi:hypothetical protein